MKSILISATMMGLVVVWSIGEISPAFAKGGGAKGGGGKGGVSKGGGVSRGAGIGRGRAVSRGPGKVKLGGAGMSRARVSSGDRGGVSSYGRGRDITGGYSGYHGRGNKGGHHGGGHHHGRSHFYFGPFGYGFYGNGFGISIGLPLFHRYYEYYTQPHYAHPYYMVYAAPIVEEEIDDTYSGNRTVIPASGDAADFQWQAEQAFRERRYDDAARFSSHALVEDSQNGKLHLFASQTFFALGEYRSAAAAIQQGAALLDRSEWDFVVENYEKFYRGDAYVLQMARLVEFIKENPNESYAYFLRGYHYKFLGYDEAARTQLAKAVELEKRDRLAAELLVMAGNDVPNMTPIPPPPLTNEEFGSAPSEHR